MKKMIFKGMSNKILLTCNDCENEFEQRASGHLRYGCANCSGKKKSTTEQFIKKAKEKFGDKFDYSKVIYMRSDEKVIIFCNTCKTEFKQEPRGHLRSTTGCDKCARRTKRITTEKFIERSIKVHDGKFFDYSEVKYTGKRNKIKLTCLKCSHKFEQEAGSHMYRAYNCPNCSNQLQLTTEIFISRCKKLHGEKYDYSKVKYISTREKVKIKCNDCGDKFEQRANDHLMGRGCPNCGGNKKLTTDIIVKRCLQKYGNDRFDYTDTVYVGANRKIKIKCNECNKKFRQLYCNHIRGYGCPFCCSSKGEKSIQKILDESHIQYEKQYRFNDCRNILPLPFDFYLTKYKICIEYDGIQHFKPIEIFGGQKDFDIRKNNDNIKNEYCKSKKILLFRISYHIPFDEHEILIKHFLNIYTNKENIVNFAEYCKKHKMSLVHSY